MRKLRKRIGICFAAVLVVWAVMLVKDREMLNRELIRLHVVANSDSEQDQAIKLCVRDAVLLSICDGLQDVTDVEQAKAYLQENLPKIQAAANAVLAEAGFREQAAVSLCKETFDTRHYDSFSLPAGVYETLRIVIGEGQGHNWWCVAFPELCFTAASSEFEEKAVEAGFSEQLSDTLSGEGYEVRFYLLDLLGEMENIFFDG